MSDDTPAARPAHQAGVVRETERPVTFREVFAIREYRAIYLALIVNWVGEYLSRAAITVLVFQQTQSVLLSAASFAISYLPWVVGGPVLAALAERYPYRRVMVTCDLLRMALTALLVIPGLPVAVLLALLFLSMLASPPTQAARSALLPVLLGRERLVVALTVNATTGQSAQVVGYFAGATLAAVNARLAMILVAFAFAASAALIAGGVRRRPAVRTEEQRSHLLQETAEGFHVVFGNRVLRSIALLAVSVTIFVIVPEGLAAAWAAQLNPNPATRGFDQGMIMAAGPVGWVIGGVLFSRFVRSSVRQRLTPVLAVVAPLCLAPAFFAPPSYIVALLTLLSGVAQGGLMPTLNGLFVLALPHGYRARAFAVVQGGVQLAQGSAVLVTGILGEHAKVPTVVGLWGAGGTLLMAALALGWPSAASVDRAIESASASGEDPADPLPDVIPYRPRHARPGQPLNGSAGARMPVNGSSLPEPPVWPTPQTTRVTHDHG